MIWIQDISPGAAANAAGMNEIQDNLDIIYAALGITRTGCVSGAGWTEFPLAGGLVDPKLNPQPQQLRDATDYAYDNKCPAHDTSVQTGYENADKDGVDGSHYPGYDSTYRYSYDNNEDTGYKSGDLVGVDSSNYPGVLSAEDINWYINVLVGVDSSNYPGYCNNENTGYKSGDLAGVDSLDYTSHREVDKATVLSTYDSAAKLPNFVPY